MYNNLDLQSVKEYAKSILEKELKFNEVLQKIENLTYIDSKEKIEEKDVVYILKLVKKELEVSGKIAIKRYFVSEDYNSLVAQLNQIAIEIENSSY
jgi:uncharacterized beta-barrel protein YwiB (DUF1934 family)